MSFKVGDRVKIVECGFGVMEMNHGKGMIGTIKAAPDHGCRGLYGLDSDEFKTPASERGDEELWWFGKELLELVDARPSVAVPAPISAVCPRCGGETQEKKTDTYGTIKKCRVCGWC